MILVHVTYQLRLKKWPWPFNGSGGSGYWAGGSNFLGEIPKSSRFKRYINRFMASLQVWPPGSIFEVLPHDPHVVFGGFERFLGSGRVNWGQIAMFRVSKEW